MRFYSKAAFRSILGALFQNHRTTAKPSKTFSDTILGGSKDAAFLFARDGLKVGLLTKAEQEPVMHAISLYVKNSKSVEAAQMPAAYARERNETDVAFSGSATFNEVGDYIQIDGPGVWIGYDTQPSRVIKHPLHIHTLYGGTAKVITEGSKTKRCQCKALCSGN